MINSAFADVLNREVARIDSANTSKRREKIISGFTADPSPRAVIDGRSCLIFNSNDYLGLRFHPALKEAEHEASLKYGTGPGAVRFISGSLRIYRDLETAIARFHGRDDAMVISSAFATNVAVLSCLIKGQSQDTLVSAHTLVISDQLNHRSIVDGIRVANLPPEHKLIYKHFDFAELAKILQENSAKFDRVVVVTDGVFSMLGQITDLAALRRSIEPYQSAYPQGIILVVDDCHGVGVLGEHGRGTEELTGTRADVLVGTFGKAFGVDGGYVVGDQVVIDYLRESAATYIYSNSIAPGSAGAALKAVELVGGPEGSGLLKSWQTNVSQLKQLLQADGIKFAADSSHPIQPVLVGDPALAKQLTDKLFEKGILVTNISYPVVAKGSDEIRVQISSVHLPEDISHFASVLTSIARELKLV
jgi:glycine C-acetyltransferase